MLFFRKKNQRQQSSNSLPAYDPSLQEPVLRCSICTGEQVAGFRDLRTGALTEIMLIRGPKDLDDFCTEYGISGDNIKKIY